MRDVTALQDVPDRADIDPAVHALRPGDRVLLLAVDGLQPGPSDAHSEQLLQHAEASARRALAEGAVEEIPHVAAWREAYRASGAEPQGGARDRGRPPESGEVVWCDDVGVARRRSSRRQTRRSQLPDGSTAAPFLLDALVPLTDVQLQAAADRRADLRRLGPGVQVAQRLLGPP